MKLFHFTRCLFVLAGVQLLIVSNVVAEEKKVDPKSIYARLGGAPAIDAAVELFYKKVLADDTVNHFFEDINMKAQRRKQKEFLGAAFGGPNPWTGKDMRKAHKNLDLTDEHFAAIAGHLAATLKDLKVDEKLTTEIMTAVASMKNEVMNRDPKKEAAAKSE